MSVLLETSLGDLVIDTLPNRPTLSSNFLKLCRAKYYNFSPINNVQRDFTFQTGDPLAFHASSVGGTSFKGLIGEGERLLPVPEAEAEVLKGHEERGTVSMASVGDEEGRFVASQFVITLGDHLSEQLDGRCVPVGILVEGSDVLEKINSAFVDDNGRPLRDIRIRHAHVLEDPYPDPPSWREPSSSPPPTEAQLSTVRIGEDESLDDDLDEEEKDRRRREAEAKAQALTLEMVGDLPFADVRPPENVLFVCKLNPVTPDDELELMFSRFGPILSCEVIRDKRTGESLQYAFIEFKEREDAERAYFKMQGVLIDDCRIHVDFSQSVSKLAKPFLERRTDGGSRRSVRPGSTGRYGGTGRKRDDLVFDESEMRDRMGKRERSRSPRFKDKRDSGRKDYGRDRSRSRDRRDRDRGHDRDRDRRDRDRDRDHGRDRDRDRHRHRDDRDRDRDRDRHRYR